MSGFESSMSYRALLAAEEERDKIDAAGAEQDEAVDSQVEFDPQTNPASQAEATPPSPDENNANENAPANNLEDFAANDDSSKADNNARPEEAAAAVVTTPERRSESASPEKKSSAPSPLKSKSPSPAPKSAASTPQKLSPEKSAFPKTPFSVFGNQNSPTDSLYSPLVGIRLSFHSEPPSVPLNSPTNIAEFANVNRDSIASISGLDSAKTESFFTVGTESTHEGWDNQLNMESEVASYWILPPPGARLAAHPPKPSFMVGRKMQLVAQRDAEENSRREMAAKEKAATRRMAEKQTHHGHVLERLADQTDDWWDWKEHVVQKTLERFNRIEDCYKAREKKISTKMFLSERQRLQKQKERLAEEKKERQEAEILNTWLMRASEKN
jgi:hypothetical protein